MLDRAVVFVSSLTLTLLLGSAAGAHPGHGEPGQGSTLAHILSEPMHVLAACVLLFVAIATVQVLRSRRADPLFAATGPKARPRPAKRGRRRLG